MASPEPELGGVGDAVCAAFTGFRFGGFAGGA